MKNIIFIIASLILITAGVMIFAHIRPAVVVSGSMEPVIHTGSLILIDEDCRDIRKRDIIAFDAAGVLVAHRVHEITDAGIITKGDANETPDPGVLAAASVKGKVIAWIPYIGYGFRWISAVRAYLTGKDEALNTFSVGNNENAIVEEYEQVFSLSPGMSIDKLVKVKNTGKNDCYVRVLAVYSDDAAREYTDIDFNTKDWELKSDGYYYYMNVLPAGRSTTELFSHVNVSENAVIQDLKGFEIYIYAETINSETGGFS